jgi:hypothetical protein
MPLQSWQEIAREHPDGDRRCEALHELASQWEGRPEVVTLLRERATHDDYWRVRAISLQLLADIGGQDDSTCKFIINRVESDLDSRVRSTAVEIVPRIWPGEVKELVRILSDWIRSSKRDDVRQTALIAICEKFRNDSYVLTLLIERAKGDSDPIVRLVAVEALVRDWRDDPQVFSFLHERAQNDNDPDVKRAANRVTLPRIKVFVSYSHHDIQYVKSLIEYISGELKRDGIDLWWDDRIVTGSFWDKEIKSKIRESHIALALVSQSFLNSDYCQKVEVRNFLRQRRAAGMVIFPIILSACAWQDYDWLSETQALPTGGKNLKSHYKASGKREELFYRVLIHLQQVAREIRRDIKW